MTFTTVDKLIISEIREWRSNRIVEIKDGKTPMPLDNSNELPKIIFHLVPKNAFAPAQIFNLAELHKDLKSLEPIYSSVRNCQYNSDGFLVYGHSVTKSKGSIGSYVQFFHNGIIEAVDLRLLHEKYIKGPLLKQDLVEALPRFLSSQSKVGIEPPIFAILSLVKINGFQLATGIDSSESRKIDKDNLFIPEIQISGYDADPGQTLKPVFDMVWNAAGLPESTL